VFLKLQCLQSDLKWNNEETSHLGKKSKPQREAAALVWNHSISIAFSSRHYYRDMKGLGIWFAWRFYVSLFSPWKCCEESNPAATENCRS